MLDSIKNRHLQKNWHLIYINHMDKVLVSDCEIDAVALLKVSILNK